MGRLEMPKEAWEAGFRSGKEKPAFDRCPYPAGSREAWAWSSGRVEGKAEAEGYTRGPNAPRPH